VCVLSSRAPGKGKGPPSAYIAARSRPPRPIPSLQKNDDNGERPGAFAHSACPFAHAHLEHTARAARWRGEGGGRGLRLEGAMGGGRSMRGTWLRDGAQRAAAAPCFAAPSAGPAASPASPLPDILHIKELAQATPMLLSCCAKRAWGSPPGARSIYPRKESALSFFPRAALPSPLLSPHTQDACWICLATASEDEPLCQPCACPRPVHGACLARWQLHSAGTR